MDSSLVPKIIDQGVLVLSNMKKDNRETLLAGYYVMPKYTQSLQNYLQKKNGAICPNVVFEISKQLLSALKAVHEAGRTYNDLKPSNIMIEFSGSKLPKVNLIDFGLSKKLSINK